MIKLLRLLLALFGLRRHRRAGGRQPRSIVEIVFWPLPFSYQHAALRGVPDRPGRRRPAGRAGDSGSPATTDRREARALRRKVRAVEYQERLKREREEQEVLEQARRKTQTLALAAPQA